MPIRDLKGFINEMPKIAAFEALQQIEIQGLASGTLKQSDSRQRLNELKQIASGEDPLRAPSNDEEIKSFLKTTGIKVVH